MKRKLFLSLFLLTFVLGQLFAGGDLSKNYLNNFRMKEDIKEFCAPAFVGSPNVFISKIRFADSERTIDFDENNQWINLRESFVINLEGGGNQTLYLTIKNHDLDLSGWNACDLKVWVDWNNDGELVHEEVVTNLVEIEGEYYKYYEQNTYLGYSVTEHEFEFNLEIPANVDENVEFGIRAMLYLDDTGGEACGEFAGGTVVDFSAAVGEVDTDPTDPIDKEELCPPNPIYRPYAFISKLQFNDDEKSIDYDATDQWIDLRETHVLGLEPGGNYTLNVTAKNYDSGDKDPYAVRIWADWNNDGVLSSNEIVGTKRINSIGVSGQTHLLEFNFDVPATVSTDGEFAIRIMMYYYGGSDINDPCGEYEGGTVVDLGGVIGEGRFEADDPDETDPDLEPVDEVCLPDFGYWSYININEVKFGEMISQTSPEGDARPVVALDYRDDETRQVHLEAGKAYQMDITVANFDSGDEDPYVVRAYVDWNNNRHLELNQFEYRTETIAKIGNPGAANLVSFTFTVPEDAVAGEPLHMRVLVHYKRALDGETDPCDKFDSGQYQEYYVFVKSETTDVEENRTGFTVYPNPTKGLLFVDAADVQAYSLFSVSGSLIESANQPVKSIDLSKYEKGIYILKLQTSKDSLVTKIVLE